MEEFQKLPKSPTETAKTLKIKRVIRRTVTHTNDIVYLDDFVRVSPKSEISLLLDSHFESRIELAKSSPSGVNMSTITIKGMHSRERRAAENALSFPPVERLMRTLLYWIGIYTRYLEEGDELGFASNSISVMKSSLTFLVMGRYDQAFKVVSLLSQDIAKYGPTPEPLDFSASYWVDLSEEIRP